MKQIRKTMKLAYFKILFVITLFFLFSRIFYSAAYAASVPDVYGKVVTTTGAGIPNVWVKMTTKVERDCVTGQMNKTVSRFERTDNNGDFEFIAESNAGMWWNNIPNYKRGRLIDTNLDGVNDEMWWPYDSNCNSIPYHYGFSCAGNPYSFSVVKPVGWTGSFSSVGDNTNPCDNSVPLGQAVCLNNGQPSTPDLLMVYTPGVSITPTPTIINSPATSPTLNPTPSISPTIPPTVINESSREIGIISGLQNTFLNVGSLIIDNPYWVRVSIENPNTEAEVEEQINNSDFELLPPSYSDPIYGETFKLTKLISGNETSIDLNNETICPDVNSNGIPDCIQNVSSNSLTISLQSIPLAEKIYLYIKVIPRKVGSVIVGIPSARISYQTSPIITKSIPVLNVNVSDNRYFFQVFGGNVYSASNSINSIYSYISNAIQYFNTSPETTIISGGTTSFGDGISSPSNQQIKNYIIDGIISYDELLNKFSDSVSEKEIKVPSDVIQSGKYIANNFSGNSLILNESDWENTIIESNTVVFVPGNLHISSNGLSGNSIRIKPDGKSSLTFIVRNNLSIDPDITNIQGVYLVQGYIDTACNNPGGTNVNSSCNPDLATNNNTKQLQLEGIFYSNSGFRLNRIGSAATVPGETFVYRPDLVFSSIEKFGYYSTKINEINE